MTRKLGYTPSEEDETIIEGMAEDITDMQDSIDEELDKVFSEFGGSDGEVEFKINVYRMAKGVRSYCFSVSPSELPILDTLRDDYKGGQFQVWVYKNGKIFKRRDVTVEPPPEKAVSNSGGDIGGIIAALANQQREMLNQMKEIVTRQPSPVPQYAPATNPMEMMGSMMGVMMQMKEFMGGGKQEKTVNEMDTFMKALEFAREFNDDGKQKGFADVATKFIEHFGPTFGEVMKQSASAPPRAMPYPAQPHQPGQPGQPVQDQQNMNIMLSAQLKMLVSKAAQNADPTLYADFILDNVADATINEYINRPDIVEFLGQYNPGVIQYRDWFEQLRASIQEGLTGDDSGVYAQDQPVTPTQEAPPDASNAESPPATENEPTRDS